MIRARNSSSLVRDKMVTDLSRLGCIPVCVPGLLFTSGNWNSVNAKWELDAVDHPAVVHLTFCLIL